MFSRIFIGEIWFFLCILVCVFMKCLRHGKQQMQKREFSIYFHLNYREMLADYYTYRRSVGRYSHRQFLADADIKGSAFLTKVINGKQKISMKLVPNIAKAIGLSKGEISYLTLMVRFCNEDRSEYRAEHLNAMLQKRSKFPDMKLSDKKLKFYQKWYYPVIRELAPLIDFQENYHLLGRMVIPRLNGDQAFGAIRFLVENGFLTKNEENRFVQVDPILSTGDEVLSTFVANYHKNNLEINVEDVDRFLPEFRDISSLVVAVSDENYTRIKDEIRLFRKRILAIAEETQEHTKVCFVGLQLVPRTRNLSQLHEEDEEESDEE